MSTRRRIYCTDFLSIEIDLSLDTCLNTFARSETCVCHVHGMSSTNSHTVEVKNIYMDAGAAAGGGTEYRCLANCAKTCEARTIGLNKFLFICNSYKCFLVNFSPRRILSSQQKILYFQEFVN